MTHAFIIWLAVARMGLARAVTGTRAHGTARRWRGSCRQAAEV